MLDYSVQNRKEEQSGVAMAAMNQNVTMIEDVNGRLRRLGYVVLLATSLNLTVFFLVFFWVIVSPSEIIRTFLYAFYSSSLFFGLIALIGVGFRETVRKQGDTLFEEISDEIQRGMRMSPQGMTYSISDDLLLRARIALRNFAKAGELPLVPGKFGPTIYAAVNLLIPILVPFCQRVFER